MCLARIRPAIYIKHSRARAPTRILARALRDSVYAEKLGVLGKFGGFWVSGVTPCCLKMTDGALSNGLSSARYSLP